MRSLQVLTNSDFLCSNIGCLNKIKPWRRRAHLSRRKNAKVGIGSLSANARNLWLQSGVPSIRGHLELSKLMIYSGLANAKWLGADNFPYTRIT